MQLYWEMSVFIMLCVGFRFDIVNHSIPPSPCSYARLKQTPPHMFALPTISLSIPPLPSYGSATPQSFQCPTPSTPRPTTATYLFSVFITELALSQAGFVACSQGLGRSAQVLNPCVTPGELSLHPQPGGLSDWVNKEPLSHRTQQRH